MITTAWTEKDILGSHDYIEQMVTSLESQFETETEEFYKDYPFVMAFVFNELAGFFGLDVRVDTKLFKRTPEEGDRAERIVEELFERLRNK